MAEKQPTLNTSENWKPVVGYEGMYEVSDHGRVRSLDRLDSGGRSIKGRSIIQTLNRYGYPYLDLHLGGGKKRRSVHHLVIESFVGPRPEGMQVDHIDNNPENNMLSNLQYVTPKQNTNRQALFGTSIADRAATGTHHRQSVTHCPRGHELVEPNLVRHDAKRGRRNCISCARTRGRIQKNPHLKTSFKEVSDSYYGQIMGAQIP